QGSDDMDVMPVAEQAQVGGEAAAGEGGPDLVGSARQPAQDRQQRQQLSGSGVTQRGWGKLFPGQLPGEGLRFAGGVKPRREGPQGSVEDDKGAANAGDDRGKRNTSAAKHAQQIADEADAG